ncbi:MAG: Cof-type HAD-IIB family hydrolase [Bacillota bacterium]|nr:Cof-type HAD-IIB family hydrolase [Bacillota bacterium]
MEKFKQDLDIKLIALDMDGTLLNDEREISLANRQAIRDVQEKGIYVVLSTGRSILKCRHHAKSLELSSYLVTVNGSEIWDDKEDLVERKIVQPVDIQFMWELSKQHKLKFWAISTSQNWHNEMPEDIHSVDWLKFGFYVDDHNTKELIINTLQKKNIFEISNSHPKNIEVNALGINKANGLKTVCSKLGIQMEQVMAIGDSQNDLAMIQEAGIGVAMGNAQEIVKKAADWVTNTNNEDGVALAIRKWVLY